MAHISSKRYVWIAVLSLVLIYLYLAISGLRGSPFGLRADVIVRKASVGIPGVSKTYEARLVNRAPWPIRVSRCNFLHDAQQAGSRLAYSVEKWDDGEQEWRIIASDNAAEFCTPEPSGIPQGHLIEGLLWPGQTLSSGVEATAAQEDFKPGDRARFVVFAGIVGDTPASVTTPEFAIDEHPTNQADYRDGH